LLFISNPPFMECRGFGKYQIGTARGVVYGDATAGFPVPLAIVAPQTIVAPLTVAILVMLSYAE
jgi:hypothetical protein